MSLHLGTCVWLSSALHPPRYCMLFICPGHTKDRGTYTWVLECLEVCCVVCYILTMYISTL